MIKLKSDDIIEAVKGYEPVGENGFNHFAVLLPMTGGLDPKLLYEIRAGKLDRQPGEICFPGGMIEKGETPLQCALRETSEEVGICPDDVSVICRLDSIITTGGSQIHCFLGEISDDALEKASINEDEVAEIFTVSVNELLNTEPDLYMNRMIQEADRDFPYVKVTGKDSYPWRSGRSPVPVYYTADRVIWGLTGRITKQFLEVIRCSE